jgi:hypothetical protein
MKKLLLLLLILIVIPVNTACSKTKENDTDTNKIQTIVPEDNIENKPDTVLDVEPDKESEVKPELTPEVKPTTKPEAKPTMKPEVKPTTKPVTKPAAKPETKPTTKPVTKPAAKPEIKPTTKPETKPTTKPEEKPEEKPKDDILTGELDKIIEEIYSKSKVQLPRTGFTEVTAENSEYFIGTNNIEFTEALASEPVIGSFPHSLVLLRVKDDADIDSIKAEIKNKVNPRKWICVGVEPENVVIDNIDNLIILILDNESEKLHKAFLSLAE